MWWFAQTLRRCCGTGGVYTEQRERLKAMIPYTHVNCQYLKHGAPREYRVASLFGAGSGLPATLGMLAGAVEAKLKQRGGTKWLTYLSIDGVSAGALIAVWLSHVNILNPYELLDEIEFLMQTGEIALAVQKWSFRKRPWALMCPGTCYTHVDHSK